MPAWAPAPLRCESASEGMLGESLPRLYTDLAGWYHLLTSPDEYGEEADFYWGCFLDAAEAPPRICPFEPAPVQPQEARLPNPRPPSAVNTAHTAFFQEIKPTNDNRGCCAYICCAFSRLHPGLP